MENVTNNKHLCVNNEENIKRKKKVIISMLEKGVDVFAVFDTETTGKNPHPKEFEGRDRILEVGFVMSYQDSDGQIKPLMLDGKQVAFQEYVNPFRETQEYREKVRSVHQTHPEALEIHQITNDFLFGKESFNGIKLHKPAPTFAELKPYMEDFLCLEEANSLEGTMHFVAHNGIKFDIPMLSEEMGLVDKYSSNGKTYRPLESMLPSVIDTMVLMKSIYDRQDLRDAVRENEPNPKMGYSLSYLAYMMNVKEEGREDFHGALLDSVILQNVFNEMVQKNEFINAPNKLVFKKLGEKKERFSVQSLPKLGKESVVDSEDLDILTIVKTDASLSEGTGTVKEYVAQAKENGLSSLLLADNVSLNRFVEFYEECNKNEIKPIIGVNFKIESEKDILNLFNKNKKSGAFKDVEEVTLKLINELKGTDYNTLSDVAEDLGLRDVVAWNKTMEALVVANGRVYMNKVIKTPEDLKKENVAKNKITEKWMNQVLSLIGEKKAALKNLNKEEYVQLVMSKKKLIKFIPFSRIEDHSDLLLVANGTTGYKSLMKLVSKVWKEGQKFVPKKKGEIGLLNKGELPLMAFDMLDSVNIEGLTAFIGHKNDVLGRLVIQGDVKNSQKVVRDLKDIFGDKIKAQISTSLQTTSRLEENRFLNNIALVTGAQGIKTIATHHAAFAKKEDIVLHKNKYAILRDREIEDFKLDAGKTKEESIQSRELLNEKFKENTAAMNEASKLITSNDLKPILNKPYLPKFKTENGQTQEDLLKEVSIKGLKKRLRSSFVRALKTGKETVNTKERYLEFCMEYKKRLDYELGIINEMEFPGYFLIKKQIVDFCKEEGITVGAGRGSAAGSLVVYALGITDVDPIEHELIFERFLNPERKEMPDIDTDIDGQYKEKVLRFLMEQYLEYGEGYEGAAYIMTKGTFAAKNSIQKIAKSKGMSNFWSEELRSLINPEPNTTLTSELEKNDLLIERYENEPKTKLIIDAALQLEKNGGLQASSGKHAGGVVVGHLVDIAPLTYVGGIPVIQYDKNDAETAGLVKFDLLVSETLTKLDTTLRNVIDNFSVERLQSHGIKIEGKGFNFNDFEYTDKGVYKMLSDGDSTNVFQLESDMFKGLLRKIKPDNIDEITAINSLGRPGPLQSHMDDHFAETKFNPEKRERYHERIDHLLDESHGTIIYQEQIMAIAQKLSGYTMGGADKLRKAMGKKKIEVMQAERQKFIDGAKENDVPEEKAGEIFDTVEKFSGYGFNKSHAMAYSLLSYKMAFLKHYYPTEFIASILTIEGNDEKKIVRTANSAGSMGVEISSPNINESENRFIPNKDGSILYGLSAIKGSKFDAQLKEREKNGEFKSIENYMKRCGNQKSLENLIYSGAMDSLPLLGDASNELTQAFNDLSSSEAKIMKRNLLMAERNMLATQMKTADKIANYVEGSMENKVINDVHSNALNNFNRNKNALMSQYLDEESSLLGFYITDHPLSIGSFKERMKKELKGERMTLKEIEDSNNHTVESKLSTIVRFKKGECNKMSKKSNLYAFMTADDESTESRIFMSNDLYVEVENAMRKQNGTGLESGELIGLEMGYYKPSDSDELRLSVESVYVDSLKTTIEKPQFQGQSSKNKQKY